MSKQTKRQKAWSDLVKLVTRPPKRYKHQRDSGTNTEIKRLRKEI